MDQNEYTYDSHISEASLIFLSDAHELVKNYTVIQISPKEGHEKDNYAEEIMTTLHSYRRQGVNVPYVNKRGRVKAFLLPSDEAVNFSNSLPECLNIVFVPINEADTADLINLYMILTLYDEISDTDVVLDRCLIDICKGGSKEKEALLSVYVTPDMRLHAKTVSFYHIEKIKKYIKPETLDACHYLPTGDRLYQYVGHIENIECATLCSVNPLKHFNLGKSRINALGFDKGTEDISVDLIDKIKPVWWLINLFNTKYEGKMRLDFVSRKIKKLLPPPKTSERKEYIKILDENLRNDAEIVTVILNSSGITIEDYKPNEEYSFVRELIEAVWRYETKVITIKNSNGHIVIPKEQEQFLINRLYMGDIPITASGDAYTIDSADASLYLTLVLTPTNGGKGGKYKLFYTSGSEPEQEISFANTVGFAQKELPSPNGHEQTIKIISDSIIPIKHSLNVQHIVDEYSANKIEPLIQKIRKCFYEMAVKQMILEHKGMSNLIPGDRFILAYTEEKEDSKSSEYRYISMVSENGEDIEVTELNVEEATSFAPNIKTNGKHGDDYVFIREGGVHHIKNTEMIPLAASPSVDMSEGITTAYRRSQESIMKDIPAFIDISWYHAFGKLYYMVGEYAGLGLNQTISTFPNIYEVSDWDEDLDDTAAFMTLLRTNMVRYKNDTVLPWPFKYLREWKNTQD